MQQYCDENGISFIGFEYHAARLVAEALPLDEKVVALQRQIILDEDRFMSDAETKLRLERMVRDEPKREEATQSQPMGVSASRIDFSIRHAGFFDPRTDSAASCTLFMEEGNMAQPRILDRVTYERKCHSGDEWETIDHSYEIRFNIQHKALATELFTEVNRRTAAYQRGRGLLRQEYTTINIGMFPVFIAAFSMLAAYADKYGASRRGLEAFRHEAQLLGLPGVDRIPLGHDPGDLIPPKRNAKFWEMASILPKSTVSSTHAVSGQSASVRTSGIAIGLPSFSRDSSILRSNEAQHGFFCRKFLAHFGASDSLIQQASFSDLVIVSDIEFPKTTDRRELEALSRKLTEAGFKNEIHNPSEDPLLLSMFPPVYTISISSTKEKLEAFLKKQLTTQAGIPTPDLSAPSNVTQAQSTFQRNNFFSTGTDTVSTLNARLDHAILTYEQKKSILLEPGVREELKAHASDVMRLVAADIILDDLLKLNSSVRTIVIASSSRVVELVERGVNLSRLNDMHIDDVSILLRMANSDDANTILTTLLDKTTRKIR